MNARNQLLCLWSGFGFFVFYGISFAVMADFLFPVPPPSMSADQVVALFREHGTIIRIGMFIGITASVLYVPWSVALFAQTKRIEQGRVAVLSYVVMITGFLNFGLFATPSALWMLAGFSVEFRPDLPAYGIQLINDTAWLLFVLLYSPAAGQAISLGIVGLRDTRENPILPRWVSYFSIWVGLTFVPAGVVALFIDGPFAWNGVIAIYIPLATYGSWFLIIAPYMHKAIRREEREDAQLALSG